MLTRPLSSHPFRRGVAGRGSASPGRHAAPRRRPLASISRFNRLGRSGPVGPLLLGGVLVATGASIAAPEAAHAFAAPAQRAGLVSAGLPAPVTPYRVVPGMHLLLKAPSWVLPVVGYQLTGRFGQVSGLWASFHSGLDFAAPEGTPIRSIARGVVVSTAYDGAFGNKTVVRLDDGTELWYCHQSAFAVHPGQRLAPGQLLGYIGSTGNTTGPHLHLEVHPHGGAAVDPQAWLPTHGLHP